LEEHINAVFGLTKILRHKEGKQEVGIDGDGEYGKRNNTKEKMRRQGEGRYKERQIQDET
jgi:hypothetical protein